MSTHGKPPYYPWQETQWSHLHAQRQAKRIPHALLLAGSAGLGKKHLAQEFAKTILCLEPQASYCNHCRSCRLFNAGTHPDYQMITTSADSSIIKIDDIRQLAEKSGQTAQQSSYKIIIIEPAEAMNIAAANALLKMLEEPPVQTVFLLISHQLQQLPATIRSRCQIIPFRTPPLVQAADWLQQQTGCTQPELLVSMANGSPLLAVRLFETAYLEQRNALFSELHQLFQQQASFVSIVEKWVKWDSLQVLQLLLSATVDLIRMKSRVPLSYITNQDWLPQLQQQASVFELRYLYKLLDKLYASRQLLMNKANVNLQLLLEDIVLAFARN